MIGRTKLICNFINIEIQNNDYRLHTKTEEYPTKPIEKIDLATVSKIKQGIEDIYIVVDEMKEFHRSLEIEYTREQLNAANKAFSDNLKPKINYIFDQLKGLSSNNVFEPKINLFVSQIDKAQKAIKQRIKIEIQKIEDKISEHHSENLWLLEKLKDFTNSKRFTEWIVSNHFYELYQTDEKGIYIEDEKGNPTLDISSNKFIEYFIKFHQEKEAKANAILIKPTNEKSVFTLNFTDEQLLKLYDYLHTDILETDIYTFKEVFKGNEKTVSNKIIWKPIGKNKLPNIKALLDLFYIIIEYFNITITDQALFKYIKTNFIAENGKEINPKTANKSNPPKSSQSELYLDFEMFFRTL